MDYKQQQDIIKYLAKLEKQLVKVYGDTYKAAIDIADVRKAIESGGTFTWNDNRQAAAKLDKMLRQMTQKVETLIANGIGSCYRQGERNVTGDVIKALGVRGKAQTAEVTAICDAATDQRRAHGQSAAAHINARRGGIQASAQIWQQNAKKEIEIIVQNGMKEGKSPSEIAQSIRGYLKEPYRYEKSVYNPTTGRLERSEAAKDYHPGQGVYRSSYKNALRMARTEMTQAYRQAEWESYQNNPLIKAYEIRLSGNHTTMKMVKGKRVPVPLTDICDKLAGVYPKTFKWVGWHPQCRCLMIPIMVSKKEFRELLEARKADREAKRAGKEATAVAKINQRAANVPLPKQYNDWLAANQDRINAARNGGGILPMWITDNINLPATITAVTATGTVTTPTLTPQQIIDMENASPLNEVVEIAKKNGVAYLDVAKLKETPKTEEIITRLGGGDLTHGSCSSLAFAYAGNKAGYDVLDFRDGMSRKTFALNVNIRAIAEKVGGIVNRDFNDYKNAATLLTNVVEGKEYYFTCGSHAAIVRKNGGVFEYLELQSSRANGWKPLNNDVLKQRFGAKRSHSTYGHKFEMSEVLIDIELLKKDYGFRKLLGYINTAETAQRKGSSGTIK